MTELRGGVPQPPVSPVLDLGPDGIAHRLVDAQDRKGRLDSEEVRVLLTDFVYADESTPNIANATNAIKGITLRPEMKSMRFDHVIDDILGINITATEAGIGQRLTEIKRQFPGENTWAGSVGVHSSYGDIRDAIRILSPGEEDVLWDPGSGYGRLLIMASLTTPVGEAKGAEIVSERTAVANAVAGNLGLDNVDVADGSILDQDMSGVTKLFTYSPFSDETAKAFLGHKLRPEAEQRRLLLVCRMAAPLASWLVPADVKDNRPFGERLHVVQSIPPTEIRDLPR